MHKILRTNYENDMNHILQHAFFQLEKREIAYSFRHLRVKLHYGSRYIFYLLIYQLQFTHISDMKRVSLHKPNTFIVVKSQIIANINHEKSKTMNHFMCPTNFKNQQNQTCKYTHKMLNSTQI